MKPEFKLGDKVIVKAVADKIRTSNGGYLKPSQVLYQTKEIPAVVGVYIGYRTALTGNVRFTEDGPEFKATGKFQYYLVVTNDRQNPIKAHPDFTF